MGRKKSNAPNKPKRQDGKQVSTSTNSTVKTWTRTVTRNWLTSLATFRLFLWRHKTLYETGWALFLGAPPFLVVNYFSMDQLATSLRTSWPIVSSALDADPIKWFVLAMLWAWLCDKTRRAVASRLNDTPSGWENAAPILLNLLGSVVGSKEQRFQAALIAANQKDPIDPGEIFNEITKPELQMREIMQNVYLAFDNLLRQNGRPRKKLKVNLALIKDGNVVKIMYHYPNDCPVLSPMSALNNPRSAIKTAVKKKRIEVVESMLDAGENPKGNFIVTDQARPDEDGSLICYPVTYKPISDVAFVISVCYLERGTFRNRFVNSYTEILEPFALRLRLEFSLLGLKEMIRNDRTE